MLNFHRLWLLIRNDLYANKKTIGLFALAIAGIIFLFGLMYPAGANIGNFHPYLYILLLFIGGFYTSSLSFKEFHLKPKNYSVLMLPASTLEKFLSKLLLSTIGFVIISMLFFFLVSALTVGVNSLLFPNVQYLFSPFTAQILYYCGIFLILQSTFFLGAIYFKKHALLKTIMVFVSIAIIFMLVNLILVTAFWGGNYIAWSTPFWNIIKTIFWVALAPCCWILSYLRLKEIEA